MLTYVITWSGYSSQYPYRKCKLATLLNIQEVHVYVARQLTQKYSCIPHAMCLMSPFWHGSMHTFILRIVATQNYNNPSFVQWKSGQWKGLEMWLSVRFYWIFIVFTLTALFLWNNSSITNYWWFLYSKQRLLTQDIQEFLQMWPSPPLPLLFFGPGLGTMLLLRVTVMKPWAST